MVLLYSPASTLNGEEHDPALRRTYEALNFCGVKLGFGTERQLASFAADGQLPLSMRAARVLVLPSVTHSPDRCARAIARLAGQGVTVVEVGERFGGLDEYGARRESAVNSVAHVAMPAT